MGGAAGHMNHPFDLDWVKSGSDLLDFFRTAEHFVFYLSSGPKWSLKWGNEVAKGETSLKLTKRDQNGRDEFENDDTSLKQM